MVFVLAFSGALPAFAEKAEWQLLAEQAEAFIVQERFKEAAAMAVQAQRQAQKPPVAGWREQAEILGLLAEAQRGQRMWDEAERSLQKSLALVEASAGAGSVPVIAIRSRLAQLALERKNLPLAEQRLKQMLSMQIVELGELDPSVSITLQVLAQVFASQGKTGEAEGLFKRALKITRWHAKNQPLAHAHALNALTVFYAAQERYSDMLALAEENVAIDQRVLGPKNPELLADLSNLAVIHFELGQKEKAETLQQRVIALAEDLFGPDHPEAQQARADYSAMLASTSK